ncbi:MAG: hypothetical protein K2Y01_05220 [Rhabdochlamydiaceae bacterium]|nr:hypothetical protein [Rhabdochlamydiaceae bacterium]
MSVSGNYQNNPIIIAPKWRRSGERKGKGHYIRKALQAILLPRNSEKPTKKNQAAHFQELKNKEIVPEKAAPSWSQALWKRAVSPSTVTPSSSNSSMQSQGSGRIVPISGDGVDTSEIVLRNMLDD